MFVGGGSSFLSVPGSRDGTVGKSVVTHFLFLFFFFSFFIAKVEIY